MIIRETTLSNIECLRKEYFESLPEFQELYLELMLANATFFLFNKENEAAGYAIISTEKVLIEFYVKPCFLNKSQQLFNELISQEKPESIYCKTFDSLLLNACLTEGYVCSILGVLFRHYCETEIIKDKRIMIQTATEKDFPLLLNQKDDLAELYETETLLRHFIRDKNLYMFMLEEDLLGCGMILRTHKDFPYHDLGVWVSSKFRRQGYATQIIDWLRKHCLENNWIPTCGCAFDNIGSQKTLEKSGFRSKYKLLEFSINQVNNIQNVKA
ncbi:MAG: GNAT family N-acetyltransferase [Bacteroidales bacterium]|nr:GNAT family N-acetyltransferase [Bacteroidales bacterium]MBN2817906.1 GNAT family N-acetyltransferase [Bacteroidales bacterium]